MKTIPFIQRTLKKGGKIGVLLLCYYLIELFFARQRDASQAASIDLSAMVSIIYSFVCLYVGYGLCHKPRYSSLTNKIVFHSPLKWFFLYTIWGGITSIWSISLPMTAFRSIECLGILFLMLAVVERLVVSKGENSTLEWVSTFVFLSIIIRFVIYITRGAEISIEVGDAGVFQCAQFIAPIFFYLPLYVTTPWLIKAIIYGMAVFSMSTTGYIGMALGAVSTFWGNKKIRFFAIIGTLVLLGFMVTWGGEKILQNTIFIEKQEISIEQSSGRDQIWLAGLAWGGQKPLTGWGFSAGESALLQQVGMTAVIGMHNTFLSAYVGSGIIGLFLIIMFWLSLLKSIMSRHIPKSIKPLFIALFMGAFIESIGNPGIGFRVYGTWLSASLVSVLISVIYVKFKYEIAK